MEKSKFNKRISEMCNFVKKHDYDNIKEQLKPFVERFKLDGIYYYGMWCEKNFEANLRSDYKRITTYTSDFSMAEWYIPADGMKAVADTLRDALTNWRDSVEYFAEIIIVLNKKAWEHSARNNRKLSQLYSELYYMARDLYFDWFDEDNKKHQQAMDYYFQYID